MSYQSNMGTPSPVETERNIALAADYKIYKAIEDQKEAARFMRELMIKYDLSDTRIHKVGKDWADKLV